MRNSVTAKAICTAKVILFASVGLSNFTASASAQSCSDPNASYHDRRFDVTVIGCVAQPVAICSIRVTAKVKTQWDLSPQNHLLDKDGGVIAATSISAGGSEVSMPPHSWQSTTMIEEGTSTRIDIKYDRQVIPDTIQYMILPIGHWTAKSVKLVPIWNKVCR